MDVSNLKRTHPQKFYLRILSRIILNMGMGDCWYEESDFSNLRKKFYNIWPYVSNIYVIVIVCNELLANLRTDLSEKERADLQQFSSAHPCLTLKIIIVQMNRDGIKVLLKRLLEGTRSNFKCLDLERQSLKQFTIYSFALGGTCFLTLFAASIEGVRVHFKEDVPIRTEIVLYPTPSDSGIWVNILRFFIELHWYWIVSMLVVIDSLTVCSLVIVCHKFKVLQKYFQELSRQQSLVSKRELEEEFQKQFVVGIRMHEDALWCAQSMQRSLGPICSVQIFESVLLLVMCLLKLVVQDRNLTYMLANLVYFACVVVITGVYMMAAGDITYEAALIPTSIFHCGWERITGRRARVLTVVALQRGQGPVVITAFGIITLSYSTFISVLRSSYSFFAVMY